MFGKKIPLYYFLVGILVTAGATFFISKKMLRDEAASAAPTISDVINAQNNDCNYDITRLAGFKYIRPLVSAAQECEAKKLTPLKLKIMDYIDNAQKSGVLINSSVFIRTLTNDDWTCVNPKESFHPASLLKVPQLITYLRMAEKNPKVLDNEYLFTKPTEEYPVQYYSAKTLQPGHTYSIKELFHFMIAYSDNYANVELIKHMDMDMFRKTFTDLNLKAPDMTDQNFTMSTVEYSKFLEVLYNAAYLNMNSSEYASELLTEAAFKDGIVKQIPTTVKVAHKMGEWGDGATVELHDCGIVYLNSNPYIITVMTRGTDMARLAEVISTISKMAYDTMAGPAL
ncbi:MAG: serine hydrolase [Bacteroidota bacterium]